MEGKHLIIDTHNIKRNLHGQNGHDTVYYFLNESPNIINMTRMISEPIVWEVREGEGKDGFSGIMPIKESHITIHTFSDEGQYWADVFSCKEFDSKKVIDFLKYLYGGDMKYSVEFRGNCNFKNYGG